MTPGEERVRVSLAWSTPGPNGLKGFFPAGPRQSTSVIIRVENVQVGGREESQLEIEVTGLIKLS